jgi:hypothetical protein
MNIRDLRICTMGICLLLIPQPAAAAELLTRAEWPAVRSGTVVVRIPALQRVMRRFEGMKQGVIVIQYPGGDRGNAWALELRDWLVALGVASNQVLLEPGSGFPDTMVIHAKERHR